MRRMIKREKRGKQLSKRRPHLNLRRLPKQMVSMLPLTKLKRKIPKLSNLKRILKKIPEPKQLLIKAKRVPDLREMTSVREVAVEVAVVVEVVVAEATPTRTWSTDPRLKPLSLSLTRPPLRMSSKVRSK